MELSLFSPPQSPLTLVYTYRMKSNSPSPSGRTTASTRPHWSSSYLPLGMMVICVWMRTRLSLLRGELAWCQDALQTISWPEPLLEYVVMIFCEAEPPCAEQQRDTCVWRGDVHLVVVVVVKLCSVSSAVGCFGCLRACVALPRVIFYFFSTRV